MIEPRTYKFLVDAVDIQEITIGLEECKSMVELWKNGTQSITYKFLENILETLKFRLFNDEEW